MKDHRPTKALYHYLNRPPNSGRSMINLKNYLVVLFIPEGIILQILSFHPKATKYESLLTCFCIAQLSSRKTNSARVDKRDKAVACGQYVCELVGQVSLI